MKKTEIMRPIREWARIKGIPEGTIGSWTKYLPDGSGMRVGTSWAITEAEFDSMCTAARSHKRGRAKKPA